MVTNCASLFVEESAIRNREHYYIAKQVGSGQISDRQICQQQLYQLLCRFEREQVPIVGVLVYLVGYFRGGNQRILQGDRTHLPEILRVIRQLP